MTKSSLSKYKHRNDFVNAKMTKTSEVGVIILSVNNIYHIFCSD